MNHQGCQLQEIHQSKQMTSQSYLDVFFQVMDGDRDVLTTSLKKRKIKSNN